MLSTKTPLPAFVAPLYDAVFPLVSAADFAATIQPTVSRQLLRSPEVILPTLAALFKHVSFDLGALTRELLAPLRSTRDLRPPR